MIRRVLKEEGVPQDLMYLAQARVGVSADGGVSRGSAGHLAIHAVPRRGIRSGPQLLGG